MGNNKIWKKFFECECKSEGIMMGYETEEDGIPCVDLAFFGHGLIYDRKLSFWQRVKWVYDTITKGTPYIDMVTLGQNTAKELGTELLRFARYPYKLGDKRNKEVKSE